jgi:hypothetical protein
MYSMLCILFTVGLMEFPCFFGQFVSEYGLDLLFQSSIALTKLIPWAARLLDVLHRSWTLLLLDRKTISVRPVAATLIPEPQAF